jgi:ribulose 1,5-bisphosphate synthetase/thiazole synthase
VRAVCHRDGRHSEAVFRSVRSQSRDETQQIVSKGIAKGNQHITSRLGAVFGSLELADRHGGTHHFPSSFWV